MQQQQTTNKVPQADRVIVQQLVQTPTGRDFQGSLQDDARRHLLAVMFAVVGLAFLLENIKPRAAERGGRARIPGNGSTAQRVGQ